ncbi:MAG: hypothetical protein ABFS30_11740, partial [Pseudomonadota bacterium]
GEIWLLKTVSYEVVTVLATQQVGIKCELSQMPGSNFATNEGTIMPAELGPAGLLAVHNVGDMRHYDDPLVLTPGVLVTWEVVDANANIPWVGRLLVYRLSA